MAKTTGPFVVSVLEVQRSLGTQRADAIVGSLADLEITDAGVPADADIHADLLLESTASHEVTITGTLRAPFVAVCRRCLGPVEDEIEVDVREVFEERPVEGETYPLTRDWLDLEQMVRDALMLALPVAPLCGPACPGPEPQIFPVSVVPEADRGEAGEDAPPRDPRWAALDGLELN